ncbi:amp dependent CoA ligase [Mycena metata]|uniref:Amp dependent CoA ligase n=1 Tax=Mycena metata TaxID=1033252 RepID=A0AAD7MLS0_9AGAR|nr:amp dependent CoA ligase [Mycena metata]
MPDFHSDRTLPHIPDDVTLEQFILGYPHEARPRRPDFAPWLVSDKTGRQIRLEEIQKRVTGLANGLHTHLGIREDDVVLILSPNHTEYPICIWAIHRLCAIVSPCNPTITNAELTHQLLQTRATSIIAHPDVRDLALAGAGEAGIPTSHIIFLGSENIESADLTPDLSTVTGLTSYGLSLDSAILGRGRRLREGEGRTKIAFLSPSTKTTGKPKILSLSHFSVVANVVQVATHCRMNEAYTSWEERRYRPGDVCLAVLPFYHIYGLAIVMHFVLFSGMTLVVAPKFDLEDMLNSIVRHKIRQLMLLPPQVALLCKEPIVRDYDLSSVHSILSGAAPLAADVTERLINMLPKAHIGQAYGSTESTGIVSMWSTRTKRGYNAGELVPGIVARVVKPDGALAEHDEAGELLIKTPSIALGYLNDEDTTNKVFVDGWLHTGDQVTINQNNEITYIDRLKEIIKVRGFEVAPTDLEACIIGHELVQDVAVVAISDNLGGTAPLAFVVLVAKASASCKAVPENIPKIKHSIMTHVAERKSSYKQLYGVEFVDEIPKDLSGKILRRVLRDQLRIPTAKL